MSDFVRLLKTLMQVLGARVHRICFALKGIQRPSISAYNVYEKLVIFDNKISGNFRKWNIENLLSWHFIPLSFQSL